ncbi:MAG TPA: hypothetical protein VF609_16275 [Flavisolibacter sp.]|jgi:hypothetical protein
MESPRQKDYLIVFTSFLMLAFFSWLADSLYKNNHSTINTNYETSGANAKTKIPSDTFTLQPVRNHPPSKSSAKSPHELMVSNGSE